MTIEQKLQSLGITLPTPASPVASYVPYVRTGNLLFLAGQLPLMDGEAAHVGIIGDSASEEDGIKAARLCAINMLAQIKSAIGDLEKVNRVVKLSGFVASTPAFTNHAKIMNGASDLLKEIFGERGEHARFAVGSVSLPRGALVEIDAVVEIKP